MRARKFNVELQVSMPENQSAIGFGSGVARPVFNAHRLRGRHSLSTSAANNQLDFANQCNSRRRRAQPDSGALEFCEERDCALER